MTTTPATPWLGVIADDYTGATDLAGMIARSGMRVVQFLGVPDDSAVIDADCVVVALKSRSIPAADAVKQSVRAGKWLLSLGVEQLYFKYCSTFDSTDDGNIGPVADALADLVSAPSVVFAPAVPEHGRTTYLGHLFVADRLLSDSSMRDHPINPMTDSDLRRVLGRQTATAVGLLDLTAVRSGSANDLRADAPTRTFFIADTVTDDDVAALAAAVENDALVTGGAALGAALAARRVPAASDGSGFAIPAGPALVLAGSCSSATRAQLAEHRADHPVFTVDVYALDRGEDVVSQALAFLAENSGAVPAVVASTDPEAVRQIQQDLGVEKSSLLVEAALGAIARGAAEQGYTRILVAGGETSGSVVNSLGVTSLRIGEEVAPGVPWTVTEGAHPVALLLKSGNFGGPHIFQDALDLAERSA